MKNLIHHGILIGSLLAVTTLPLGAQPPQPGRPSLRDLPKYLTGDTNTTGDTNGLSDYHGRHGQWREKHEEIRSQIKAEDAELEQLLTQMTNSPPAQKGDATSALVAKLVEDRLALHQKLEAMHGTNADSGTNTDQGTNTDSSLR
jgi:hypothetical protein